MGSDVILCYKMKRRQANSKTMHGYTLKRYIRVVYEVCYFFIQMFFSLSRQSIKIVNQTVLLNFRYRNLLRNDQCISFYSRGLVDRRLTGRLVSRREPFICEILARFARVVYFFCMVHKLNVYYSVTKIFWGCG